MLSPQALIKSLVNRALPAFNPDSANNDISLRLDSYGGVFTQPMVRKQAALADEGTYFVQTANQTGITPPLGVAFSQTTSCPALIVYNNTASSKLALDYISLTNIVAVTATSATAGAPNFWASGIDNSNRVSSGGTALQNPINVNGQIGTSAPLVTSTFGAITGTSATTNFRQVVGQRVLRPNASTSAITVVGDQFFWNFGGVEGSMAANITITNPNLIPMPHPPVVIGPQQSYVLYMWWANSTPAGGASGFLPEVGYWIR